MIITNKILKVWNPVIKDLGITAVANGAGVNFRTFKRALDNKVCSDPVYDKVQAFVVSRNAEVKKKLQEQDQD